MKKLAYTLVVLSLVGVVVSSYALYLHYKPTDSFCNLSETFNCDVVNTGPYSELYGVPVAALGIAGYVALIIGGFLSLRMKRITIFVFLASIAGLVFALYLTGLEAFVIETYCVVCLASQVIILATTIISLFMYVKSGKKENKESTNQIV